MFHPGSSPASISFPSCLRLFCFVVRLSSGSGSFLMVNPAHHVKSQLLQRCGSELHEGKGEALQNLQIAFLPFGSMRAAVSTFWYIQYLSHLFYGVHALSVYM